MIQAFIAVILFFVIFFGISFILNMLLRRTWFMAVLYPLIVLMFVDQISTKEYFSNPGYAFSTAYSNIMKVTFLDAVILIAGFIGTIGSGIVIRILRKSGYQMF